MKTNSESRFREGINLSSDSKMFDGIKVVEYDLVPLIELEVTIFEARLEIFYRISKDNYIQLLERFLNEDLKILAQFKRTSLSLREDIKGIVRKYIEASSLFNGQPKFLKGEYLTEVDFKQIIDDINKEYHRNNEEAIKNKTPLINYIASLDLDLRPKGDSSNNWISKCPNGRNHFLMISTLNDEWGCGYCKKKGKLKDLKKWIGEIEQKALLI